MIQRVRYLERQILTADALNQEQTYRLVSHRQHNFANHDWGILQGLHFDPEEGQLWLAKGAAVDGYGRELFVSEPFPIRPELFTALYPGPEDNETMIIDLWLRYAREENQVSQNDMAGCDPNQKLRSQEEARLCVTRPPRDEQGSVVMLDPRRPSGVPVDDLDFPPFREPPDDPARSWPVYLGRLRWSMKSEFIAVDKHVRLPYANLVGTLLRSASRQPGPEDPTALTPPTPVARAQIEMAPRLSGRPPFTISCADDKSNLTRRLAVLWAGNIRAKGRMIVVSELTEDERLRLPPDTDEKGRLSKLRIGRRGTQYFNESMILHPSRLASKIMAGALPLQEEAQKATYSSMETLFFEPRDTPEQKRNLRQRLARLLNEIANQESLIASPRLRNVRLRRDTWEQIHSLPKKAESAPLNARIIMELFSTELRGNPMQETGEAIELAPLGVPETTQAMPWSLYRVEKQDENGTVSSEFRFESFDPGDKDDPTLYRFAIGKFDAGLPKPAFVPCLSVDASCNVTIHGNLTVTGELIQSPVQVDPNDPRYVDQLVQSWEQGETAAAGNSLQACIRSIEATGNATSWSYVLAVKNASKATITDIRVLDTFLVGGRTSGTIEMAQHPSLAPDEAKDITVQHASPLPGSGKLYIAVSVQGRLPSGATAYTSAPGETQITTPQVPI